MKKHISLLAVGLLTLTAMAGCKTKERNNSGISSSDDSSIDVSSSIEDIVGGVVTKEEYLKAFEDYKKETNVTTNVVMQMEMAKDEEDLSSTYMSYIRAMKRDSLKYSTESKAKMSEVFDEDFFNDLYKDAKTEEEKENIYKEFKENLLDDDIFIKEEKENYLEVYMILNEDEDYSELIDGDELFGYDYVYSEDFYGYFRSRMFIEDCEAIEDEITDGIIDLVAKENFYNLLKYNEDSESYIIENLTTLIKNSEIGELIEDITINNANLTVKFDNRKLIEIKISLYSSEGDSIVSSVNIQDRGTTIVDLPTNIVTCPHYETSYLDGDYTDKYHYQYCKECYEVIAYEEHKMVLNNKICSVCDYDHDSENVYALDLGDEHFSSHVFYHADEENGESDLVSWVDMGWNSDLDAYACTCEEKCGLIIKEEFCGDFDIEGYPCAYKHIYRYTIIDSNTNEILSTIDEVSYYQDHNFEYNSEVNPNNPCEIIYTEKCSDCGLELTAIGHDHEFNSTYRFEECKCVETYECTKCNEAYEVTSTYHKNLVIDGIVDGNQNYYNCHCDCCGEEVVKYYRNFTSINPAIHNALGISERGYMTQEYLEHDFDDNGVCTYCGYDISEDNYTVEKIYYEYEGLDYMFIVYDKSGNIVELEYPVDNFEIVAIDGNYCKLESKISNYWFETSEAYSEECEARIGTMRIYRGEELIKEITQVLED